MTGASPACDCGSGQIRWWSGPSMEGRRSGQVCSCVQEEAALSSRRQQCGGSSRHSGLTRVWVSVRPCLPHL